MRKLALNKSRPSNSRGFTLVELLVVISIIGILSSAVFASLVVAKQKAVDANLRTVDNQIRLALDSYFASNGVYPAPGSASSQYCIGSQDCALGGVPIGTYISFGEKYDKQITEAIRKYDESVANNWAADIAYAGDIPDFDFPAPATSNFPLISGTKGFIYTQCTSTVCGQGSNASITGTNYAGTYTKIAGDGWACSGDGCTTSSGSPTTCTSWTYSDWGTCSSGTQSRSIITSTPSGCTGGSPDLTQSCSSSGCTGTLSCTGDITTCGYVTGCNWGGGTGNSCQGTPDCGGNDVTCGNVSGCSYGGGTDPGCYGTPNCNGDAGSCGNVSGCSWGGGTSEYCSGSYTTTEDCGGMNQSDCISNNCSWNTDDPENEYCSGSYDIQNDCSGISPSGGMCANGCTYNAGTSDYCSGTPSDSCSGDSDNCGNRSGCSWDDGSPDGCSGTPSGSCDGDESTCTNKSGCDWTGMSDDTCRAVGGCEALGADEQTCTYAYDPDTSNYDIPTGCNWTP